MKTMIIFIASLAIVGCANQATYNANAQSIGQDGPGVGKQSVHYYVEQLARQLFMTSKAINFNQSVAVGTFLPMTDIGGKNMPLSNVLGLQIQESLVTLATQAGLNVIEFKAARGIKIQKNQDVMLSRKLSDINTQIEADYYLTGTHYIQDQSVVVNARLIDVATQDVIAAATDVIPRSVMWDFPEKSRAKITMIGSNIYRRSN